METSDLRARTASALATAPLGLLAITFFLPFLRTCDVMGSPLALAVPIAVFGTRRRAAWEKWFALTGAFAVLAAHHAVWVVGALTEPPSAEPKVGLGGWLYLACDGALLLLAAVGARWRRL